MQSEDADVLLDSKFMQALSQDWWANPCAEKKKIGCTWVHELKNVSMVLRVTHLSSHTAPLNILNLALFLTLPPLVSFLTPLRPSW
jgi:hypothetical protein